MGKTKHFYAVSRGRKIGIYTCYSKAHEQTLGYRCGTLQGYNTLHEARQVMKDNGYHDPPIFDHRKQTVQSSSSESDLEVTLYKSNDARADINSIKPVLVVEHPNLDIEDLFVSPRRSSSEGHIHQIPAAGNPNSVDKSDSNTFVKQLVQPSSAVISESNTSYKHSGEDACQVTDPARNLPLHSTEKEIKDSKPVENSSPVDDVDMKTILENLLAKVGSLTQEMQFQQESISKVVITTQRIMEDQSLLKEEVNTIHKDQVELAALVKSQISSLNDDTKEMISHRLAKLKCENEQLYDKTFHTQVKPLTQQSQQLHTNLENLKSQVENCCLDIDKLAASSEQSLAMTQQLFLLVDKQNDLLKSHTIPKTCAGQPPTVPPYSMFSKCQGTSAVHETSTQDNSPRVLQSTSENSSSLGVPEITNPPLLSPTDESSNSPQHTYDGEDTDIIFHHPSLNHNISGKERMDLPGKKLYQFRFPDACKHILIGDTNMQTLSKKRFDPSGATEIRTFKGANIRKVWKTIESTQDSFPKVESVTFCLGAVDCNKDYINEKLVVSDIEILLASAKKVFPNASFSFLSIPPQANHKINLCIQSINFRIKACLQSTNSIFLRCNDLWDMVDSKGFPEKSIFVNGILLSRYGLNLLLKPLKLLIAKHTQPRPNVDSLSSGYVYDLNKLGSEKKFDSSSSLSAHMQQKSETKPSFPQNIPKMPYPMYGGQSIPPNFNACNPPPPFPPVWYFHMHAMMQRMYNSLSMDINEKIKHTLNEHI